MTPSLAPFPSPDPAAIEERIRVRDRNRLLIAFMAAVLIHAAPAIGLAVWTPPEPVTPPGEMVITIDLAPAMMAAASQGTAGEAAQAAPEEVVPPEAVEEPVVEPVSEPQPEPLPEPDPVEEVSPQPEPAPAPQEVEQQIDPLPEAPKAEVVVAPKKKAPPKPKTEAKPRAKPDKEVKLKADAKPRPKAAATAASAASAPRRSDVAGRGASAKPSDLANYIGRVRGALERRKRYPGAAGGATGKAQVRFTINKSGQITGFTLTRSSGNAVLDAAARAMVQGASLPAIPDGLPSSLTIGVPVDFTLR